MSCGIVLFTKDRVNTLERSLPILQSTGYPIIVIDDSCEIQNRMLVRGLASMSKSTTYFGIEEYDSLMQHYRLTWTDWGFLLRSPGIRGWNLGYMRNLALILVKHFKFDRAAFFDDDIVISDARSVDDCYLELDHYSFSGPEIVGLRDDSLIGHVSFSIGHSEDRLLSGGCIFFLPRDIRHYFMNVYNEDWIWLLLHGYEGMHFTINSKVEQLFNDPFESSVSKIGFQEEGELLLNCFAGAKDDGIVSYIQDQDFWDDIVERRLNYLDSILSRAEIRRQDPYFEIVSAARAVASGIKGEHLKTKIEEYYRGLAAFQEFYLAL